MDTKLKLMFGRNTYPEDVQAVWGARLIFPADLVHDRQDLDSKSNEAKMELMDWLNGSGMGDGAIGKMLTVLRNTNNRYEIGLYSSKEDNEAVIYEDEKGKIIGSAQASHGYLYVAGWLKAHTKEGN